MRRISRFFIVLAFLIAPVAATAVPVQIDVITKRFPGFMGSSIHSTDGCESGGLWMCGTTNDPINGLLTADFESGRFTDIKGTFWSVSDPSETIAVLGGMLDFTVPEDDWIGSIEVEGYGSFEFIQKQLAGPANSFDGEQLALWGQNHKPTSDRVDGGFGIDIAATVAPIPEPNAALAFGIGTLLVMGRRRIRS